MVPVVTLQRDSAFVSVQRKTQGLLTPWFTLTAACRDQCMGMAEHAEVSTAAELYSTSPADISQRKPQRLFLSLLLSLIFFLVVALAKAE